MSTLEIEAIYRILAPMCGTLGLEVRARVTEPNLFSECGMDLCLTFAAHFLLIVYCERL
jgi:hypothetical protein